MRTIFYLLLNVAFVCSVACTPQNSVSSTQDSTMDSVLVYKINGLKEFIKVADYWGDDTESYWAFDKASAILDSISDNSNYEESLARIYAATSYVSYGLSYVPSVIEASRQYHLGESNTFPKVGIKESGEIIIDDYNLPLNDTLYNVSRLEFRALYSILYFYKAINLVSFEERVLHNYDRSMLYEDLYSKTPPKTAYRLSSVLNMQVWYNYIITCAQLAYWENHGNYANLETEPWKEFIELAYWHDSLMNILDDIVEMNDDEFHRIELKAAYSQYIMLSYIADNLSDLKEKTRALN